MTVGMTCTDGIYVNERRLETGDCSGPRSARDVLLNPPRRGRRAGDGAAGASSAKGWGTTAPTSPSSPTSARGTTSASATS